MNASCAPHLATLHASNAYLPGIKEISNCTALDEYAWLSMKRGKRIRGADGAASSARAPGRVQQVEELDYTRLAPHYRAEPPPWSQKVPRAVFAGHCYPTLDSSRPIGPRVPMRSMLCD
eukprot:scaffold45292_cov15-Tisochrysis_lutea.AAC.1